MGIIKMKPEKSKIGWFTTFSLPSKIGICDWYGCGKPVFKNGFCKECGNRKIKVIIVDH
jgi:hypothetical protein